MDIIKKLAEERNIGRHQAKTAVKLIDENNTIPFARYCKEATSSLDDEVLRNLDERIKLSCVTWKNPRSWSSHPLQEHEKLTP